MSDQGSPPSDPYQPPSEGQPPAGGQEPGYYYGAQPPQSGNPQSGNPQFGQPQFGEQPQYGQPQYGQPQYGTAGYPPGGQPPQNYLVWAILSTVFCCLPLGIVSIVYAAQVNSKWAMGDVAGAQESSRKAKQFAIWSAVSIVILLVLGAGLAVLGLATGSSSSTSP